MASIRRAEIFNGSAPGANTDIIATDITPKSGTSAARIEIALTNGSPVNLTATDGTTTHTWALGAGITVTAETITTFHISTNQALAYNVQVEIDGVIESLIWDDIVERA